MGPRATFTPITTKIDPGGNITLGGQVTGLDGRSMWIFEQITDSPEKLVISSSAAVATADGDWRLTAEQVGDASDRKSSVKFVAVAANTTCDQELVATVTAAGNGEPSVKTIPAGCMDIGHLYVDFAG